jgi:hypothetical protein
MVVIASVDSQIIQARILTLSIHALSPELQLMTQVTELQLMTTVTVAQVTMTSI